MLELTVDKFLRGSQELVLLRRHPETQRTIKPATRMGAETRRQIKEALRSREVHCHVTFGVADIAVKLRCEGVYEHEGHLCRIVYLSQKEAEGLDRNAEPAELEGLKISGWVAERYYATPPNGLRLYYHVFDSPDAAAEICQSWYREFPLADEAEMRSLVATRTQRIAEAFKKPDEALPECTLLEREGRPGAEYSKCRDWCPARAHCQQINRYYDAATARWVAGERALAAIVADPEELAFADKERQRRKQQISTMLMAGNFFEDEFPRDVFRKLILEEAEDDKTDPAQSSAYREMATSWSNADFIAWRAWLDSQH